MDRKIRYTSIISIILFLFISIYTIEITGADDTNIINLITNPGFESGKAPWMVYPTTNILYSTVSPGSEGIYSAKLGFSFTTVPIDLQFYQPYIKNLELNTTYRLSFVANSSTGHDLRVKLNKTLRPYTSYGLNTVIDLSTTLQEYSVEFTTINSSVTDGCLQFYLNLFAEKTDIYYIDNVRLEKVIDVSPIPSEVVGNAPAGTNVPVTSKILVNFSKPMNQASVQAAFLTIPATTGSFSWSGNTMTYVLGSNLNPGTTYNVTIGTGATDLTGSMLSSYNWQFTTASSPLKNLIKNPGFESGKAPWAVYPATSIVYSTASPGSEGIYSAKLGFSFTTVPVDLQFYQPYIKNLEPIPATG